MPAETVVALAAILAIFGAFMAIVAYIDSRFWRSDERAGS